MTNPFQTAPRCVQWAAVILGANPVFQIVVALNVMFSERFISLGPKMLPSLIIQLAFSFGLLFGLNLARLLAAVLLIYMTATKVLILQRIGMNSISSIYDITVLLAPWIAVGLCFLPAANRYFSGEKVAESEVPATVPTAAPAPAPTGNTWISLGLLAVAASVALVAIKHFVPVLEDMGIQGREVVRAYQEANERAIIDNCRNLAMVVNEYFLEHPALNQATFADLRYVDKYLKASVPIAGETYPTEFTRDGDMTVVLRDGARLVYNPNTGDIKHLPAAQ